MTRISAVLTCLCVLSASAVADKPEAKPTPKVQIAILLDTSNSMDGLINQARTQLWKIVNELGTARFKGQVPDLEVALYEYGNNRLSKESGHVRKVVALSDDLDMISEKLFNLKTSGGNEYCGWVIRDAVRDLKWTTSKNDLRLIYVCGNEPFSQGPVKYQDAISAAKKKDIVVNTIFCGPEHSGVTGKWSDGAKVAGGSFLNIDQSIAVAAVKTPFDKKLVGLSTKLNKTYVTYGAEEKRKQFAALQKKQDDRAKNLAPGAAPNRAIAKAGKSYKYSSVDLIDAVRDKKVKLEDLKKEQLPKELQKLSVKECQEYIAKKAAERAKIKVEIQKLAKQRDAFVAKERAKQAKTQKSSFDEALIKSVQTQGAKKNYLFKK